MAILSRFVTGAAKLNYTLVRHLIPPQTQSHKKCFQSCSGHVYHNNRFKIKAIMLKTSCYNGPVGKSRYGNCSRTYGVLTSDVITEFISENEHYVDISEKTIKFIETNQLPANIPIQDKHAEVKLSSNYGLLFGVFDGHGGYSCSTYVSECLFAYLAICLEEHVNPNRLVRDSTDDTKKAFYEGFIEWVSSPPQLIMGELDGIVMDNLRRLIRECSETSTLCTMERLKTAFVRLDRDLTDSIFLGDLESPLAPVLKQTARSGSCATVAYVYNNDLYVANVGDSRAIIGTIDYSGNMIAQRMSYDHNFRNQNEIDRLNRSHPGESSTLVVNKRLLGYLSPLRAFGDIKLKWSLKDLNRMLIPTIIRNYNTPPYLTAEPDIVYHRINKDDKFLVLATDGFWDVLSPQRVATLIHEHMMEYKGASRDDANIKTTEFGHKTSTTVCDRNCATFLIRHALGFYETPVLKQLKFAPDVVRRYRDDITITIVYFDNNYEDCNI